jgi:AraC family transcriptional regulator
MPEPDVFVREYAGLSTMAPHEHQTACLSIVVRGGFLEQIGERHRTYERDDIAFCPAGVTHSQSFDRRGARQIIINTRPEWLDYLSDCKVALEDSPHVRSRSFGHAADLLLADLSRSDPFSSLFREGLILEIVAAFGRGWHLERTKVRSPAWLRVAEDFINANALGNINVETIASVVRRHPIHLCREFRRYFGVSVGAYIRRLRVQEATRLLNLRQLTLSEIALDCGFSSHSHLCREFKRQIGVTPSQYRLAAGVSRSQSEFATTLGR